MELHEALQQIDVIRRQVARTEVFRGYRAATVACSGLLAFVAAALQPLLAPQPVDELQRYLQLWICVAAVSVILVASELAIRWASTKSPLSRQQTVRAVEQFVPCLVVGAGITWAIARFSVESAHLLPGLWAVVFSLGIFASVGQLPRLSVCVGVFYLVGGVVCLVLARGQYALSPRAMAGTFGLGQLLTAAVLYFTLERKHE
jgi:hypothetical protein